MTARQARFQIVDVIASMKPLTKMPRQIVSAASIPTGRRGPWVTGGSTRVGVSRWGMLYRHKFMKQPDPGSACVVGVGLEF